VLLVDTVGQLSALYAHAALAYVGGAFSTGVHNVMEPAALGVPTLTLFGPKDPDLLAPKGPRARAVRAGVRCSPCALRSCPDPVCMTTLPVDLVLRNALELLA